jgi:hypothetical protein
MIFRQCKIYLGILVYLTFSTVAFAEENDDSCGGKNSIIFLGFLKHVENDSRSKEGYMELFGYSRELCYGKFMFDTGVNTFVDSYEMRAYSLFSNISYMDFHYKIFTPMLEVGVTNKGEDYDSTERQTYPFIIPKVRIGAREGFFGDISGLPKIGDITNGWVALEVGYKW